jgi:hypothetical protein
MPIRRRLNTGPAGANLAPTVAPTAAAPQPPAPAPTAAPAPAPKPAAQPGLSYPGAPPKGTAGSVNLDGVITPVNAAGIISEGPHMGKYPTQVPTRWSEANTSVNTQLLPEINSIDRAQQELEDRHKTAVNDTASRGAREVANLAELYNRLGNFQGQVQQNTNAGFSQAAAKTGTAYDQLAAQLGQTFDSSQASAGAEADRLGLGGLATNSMQGSERDQQYLQQLAGLQKQSSLDNVQSQQGGFNGLMGMMMQNAQQESAGAQTAATRGTNKSIADMFAELNINQNELSGQRTDIEAQRGGLIMDLVRKLEEQAYARKMEQDEIRFRNEMAEKNYGLDVQQFQAGQQEVPLSDLDMLKYTAELQKYQNMLNPSTPAYTPGTRPRATGTSNYNPSGPGPTSTRR